MAIRSNNWPRPSENGIPGMGGGLMVSGWYIDPNVIVMGNDCWVGLWRIVNGDLVGNVGACLRFDVGYIVNMYDDSVLAFSRTVAEDPLIYPPSNNKVVLGASNYRWKDGFFVNIHSSGGFTTGDIVFKNDWVITEEEDKLIFINPAGKKVVELAPNGEIKKITNDNKVYNNAQKLKEEEKEMMLCNNKGRFQNNLKK